MKLVRLEPVALQSRVKQSTTEPLRSLRGFIMLASMMKEVWSAFRVDVCSRNNKTAFSGKSINMIQVKHNLSNF